MRSVGVDGVSGKEEHFAPMDEEDDEALHKESQRRKKHDDSE
jgi:hypothetical protein